MLKKYYVIVYLIYYLQLCTISRQKSRQPRHYDVELRHRFTLYTILVGDERAAEKQVNENVTFPRVS